MAGELNPWRGTHRGALAALVVLVVAVHAWITGEVAGGLRDASDAAAMPPRIEVAYVRDMQASVPPAAVAAAPVAAPAPAPPRAMKPRPVAKAASAPDAAASQALLQTAAAAEPPVAELPIALPPATETPVAQLAETMPQPAASAALAVVDAAASAASAAPAIAAADASAAMAVAGAAAEGVPFDWPVSTRLSYRLTGYFRGDVEGEAQVEWVRSGARYQVHLDVLAGLPVAPLFTRRMSSDGEITAAGLAPRRYDQDTKVAFRDRKRDSLLFEPDGVVLANGQRRDTMAGLQDTASQFVQLSYLFATRPELLRAGASVEFPLALPRKLERWAYDVLAQETVHAPFGALETFHLKPRRETGGGDLVVEMWLAPALRYLPVRIRIRQDAETYIDLMISRPPEMAAVP